VSRLIHTGPLTSVHSHGSCDKRKKKRKIGSSLMFYSVGHPAQEIGEAIRFLGNRCQRSFIVSHLFFGTKNSALSGKMQATPSLFSSHLQLTRITTVSRPIHTALSIFVVTWVPWWKKEEEKMGLRWSFTTSDVLKGIYACDPLKRKEESWFSLSALILLSVHFS